MVKSFFCKVRPKLERFVPRVRQKTESFLHSGILDTFTTTEEFTEFGDENNHFRDFSLQTIIRAEAVELLKPVGALPFDALRAADVLDTVTSTFDQMHREFSVKVDEMKQTSSPNVASNPVTNE